MGISAVVVRPGPAPGGAQWRSVRSVPVVIGRDARQVLTSGRGRSHLGRFGERGVSVLAAPTDDDLDLLPRTVLRRYESLTAAG